MTQAPPLRDQVHDALETLIINRTLAPGQRLVEADLAERLGVSRNPVREALNALHRAGWVDIKPRQGAYVRRQLVSEVEEFFHVRTLLEVESARLAAERATDESVADLRRLLHAGETALRTNDEQALLSANAAFHKAMAAMAGNQVLNNFLAMMEKRLRWYFAPVVVVRGPHSWKEHAALVEALAAKDTEQAAQLMRRHTTTTADAYRQSAHHIDQHE
jgi:DNA-binding GntR family transcriptional regulator